jgi:hypothetical protein
MVRYGKPKPEIGICYGCHNRVLLNERRLCMMCANMGGPVRVVIKTDRER